MVPENGSPAALECDSVPAECGNNLSVASFDMFADPRQRDAYANADYACVLERLKDRSGPFRIELVRDAQDSIERRLILMTADGDAVSQVRGFLNGRGNFMEPVQRCSLAAPSLFQACIDAPALDCFDAQRWLTSCEAAPPQCPP